MNIQTTGDLNASLATNASNRPIAVQVVRHKVIAPDVITLSLAHPGTRQAPTPYLPGQFITLVLSGTQGYIYRSYSLCGNGDPRLPWEITIKRYPDGLVSNYLYEQVHEGMTLYALPPRGAFILPPSLRPEQTFVFVAVGSGIAPIMGFLRAMSSLPAGSRPHVQLHYASRSAEETIYRNELLRMTWVQQKNYLRTEGPRVTPQLIFANARPLPRDAQWYMCGPEAFTSQLSQALSSIGVPASFIHTELFVDQSRQRVAAGASRPVVGHITIKETGKTIDARERETLLDALERQDYQPAFGCRVGTCGTCQLQVLQGRVRNPGSSFLTPVELRSGLVLGCIAQPEGDITIASGGTPPRGTAVIARSEGRRASGQKWQLRLVATLAISLMTVGLWQLTDHTASATATSSTTVTPTATSGVASTATPTKGATATPTAGVTPTATTAPTPTPTTAPTPTPTTKTSSS